MFYVSLFGFKGNLSLLDIVWRVECNSADLVQRVIAGVPDPLGIKGVYHWKQFPIFPGLKNIFVRCNSWQVDRGKRFLH